MIEFLTRPRTLWVLVVLTLVQTALFGLVMFIWDFHIIDEIYKPEQLLAHLEGMSPLQKKVHLWMTATLDVLYPLTYGPLFVGAALYGFKRYGVLLACLIALVIPFDLAEGVTQVLLLQGHTELASLKTLFTKGKFVFYGLGLIVAFISLYRGMRSKS